MCKLLVNKIPRSDSGTFLDVIDLSTGATMGPTATMVPPGTMITVAATIHYPLIPKFAGSNPAKAVGFLKGDKNPQHAFLRKGSKIISPMSQIFGM